MNNELTHYGVLGMKWGIRRAAKKGKTYSYKSHTTKKYERKASSTKDAIKAAKYKNRAKRSAEMDRKEQSIAEKASTGKLIVAGILTGGGANMMYKNYQRYTAMGNSKTKAILKSAFLHSPIASIQKAKYIRQDEKNEQ